MMIRNSGLVLAVGLAIHAIIAWQTNLASAKLVRMTDVWAESHKYLELPIGLPRWVDPIVAAAILAGMIYLLMEGERVLKRFELNFRSHFASVLDQAWTAGAILAIGGFVPILLSGNGMVWLGSIVAGLYTYRRATWNQSYGKQSICDGREHASYGWRACYLLICGALIMWFIGALSIGTAPGTYLAFKCLLISSGLTLGLLTVRFVATNPGMQLAREVAEIIGRFLNFMSANDISDSEPLRKPKQPVDS